MALFTTLATMATAAAATTAGTVAATAALPALGATAVPLTAEAAAMAATGAEMASGVTGGVMGAVEGTTAAATGAEVATTAEGVAATGAGEGGVASTTAPTTTSSVTKAADTPLIKAGKIADAASTVGSMGMQYKAQQAQQAAMAQAQKAQGRMASLQARNRRLDALSQSRIKIGNIQATAGAMGLGENTSAVEGGVGGIQTQLGKTWSESRSLEGLAQIAGNANQAATNYGMQASGWQMLTNFANKTMSPTLFQKTNNPNANLSTNTINF